MGTCLPSAEVTSVGHHAWLLLPFVFWLYKNKKQNHLYVIHSLQVYGVGAHGIPWVGNLLEKPKSKPNTSHLTASIYYF